MPPAIMVTVDSGFIRSREDGERLLMARSGPGRERCTGRAGLPRQRRRIGVPNAGMPDHDALYRLLFGDPRMVVQLLREFAPGALLDSLALEGVTRMNANFLTRAGERREGDMIWRIPLREGGDTYLVLLLEFQSAPERWMALRAMVYAGLLWQHLVTERSLPPDGNLPPVFSLVLYNGDRRWAAPLALRELIGLPEASPLWRWQPDMRYHLIDEGAYGEEDLERRDALPALLFRLEGAPDPGRAVALADALIAWFARHPGFEELRNVFAGLLGGVLARVAPGVSVPDGLVEVRDMLATQVETWKQHLFQEGEQKGRQEGRQEGRREGRQEGEAALLLRLLERRFGDVPIWARDRIAAADTAALEEWSLRVLDAGSLDDALA
jgi:hypothetical protein